MNNYGHHHDPDYIFPHPASYPNGTICFATVRIFADTMTFKQLVCASNHLNAKVRSEGPSDNLAWVEHTRKQLGFAMDLQTHERTS